MEQQIVTYVNLKVQEEVLEVNFSKEGLKGLELTSQRNTFLVLRSLCKLRMKSLTQHAAKWDISTGIFSLTNAQKSYYVDIFRSKHDDQNISWSTLLQLE